MKKLLSALFLLCVALVFAQNQLKVVHRKTGKPVYNAAVYCDDELIGRTNFDGVLSFKTKCPKIEIIASNFEDATAEVKKSMQVSLSPLSEKLDNIEKVIITDKSDPRALKMLDEMNDRAKENAPRSLDSYEFKSYTKLSIDVDKDSVDSYKQFLERRQDSLATAKRDFKQKDKEKKDSLMGEEFLNSAKDAQKFLWEKATEHRDRKSVV